VCARFQLAKFRRSSHAHWRIKQFTFENHQTQIRILDFNEQTRVTKEMLINTMTKKVKSTKKRTKITKSCVG
jgi:hypothetical protein